MSRTITTAAELDALPEEGVLLEASGRYRYQRGTFEQCWVRLVPSSITGATDRVWEVLVHGSEIPHSLVHTEDLDLPVTVLHDPSAPAPAPSVVPEAAVEALREWDVDESDVTALREAAVEAAAWKLIDRTTDLADRGPSDETVQAALTDARAALPFLTAAPSATREEVARALEGEFGCFLARDPHMPDAFWGGAADALLASFTITPKENR